MYKIKTYLFKTSINYIFLNLLIILFLVIFLNFIELSRSLDNQNKNIYSYIYLSIIQIPSIINETSPFVIIISTSFIFRYLINNNELISMRNVGFSIFDIFQPISFAIFIYGLLILFFLNPLSAILDVKYDKLMNNKNEDLYSINIESNGLWIKTKNYNDVSYFINIDEFDIKLMYAENIKILSIEKNNSFFINARSGNIKNKVFYLENVNFFDIKKNNYNFENFLNLDLNFTKDNILKSLTNYKNIPYYNYLEHTKTLKKFNLYSPEISLYYLSEILKPLFMILLSFVVMGFSAKFKRNENFFRVLFYSVFIGFLFFFLKEIINKFTLSFNINFLYSYMVIFMIPFLIGLYKVIQVEND